MSAVVRGTCCDVAHVLDVRCIAWDEGDIADFAGVTGNAYSSFADVSGMLMDMVYWESLKILPRCLIQGESDASAV